MVWLASLTRHIAPTLAPSLPTSGETPSPQEWRTRRGRERSLPNGRVAGAASRPGRSCAYARSRSIRVSGPPALQRGVQAPHRRGGGRGFRAVLGNAVLEEEAGQD